MRTRSTFILCGLMVVAASASAQNKMLDALKNGLGNGQSSQPSSGGSAQGGTAAALGGLGLAMPQIGSGTAGNAAGVLQYCIKNKYLSADAASGVKDKLLGMVTGQKTQQTGYANGSNGLLQGSDGKSFSLKNVGGKLKTKACDYVLDNAKSLV